MSIQHVCSGNAQSIVSQQQQIAPRQQVVAQQQGLSVLGGAGTALAGLTQFAGTPTTPANSALGTVQNSLQQGVVPSLATLNGLMADVDPSSPEGQQLQARIITLLSQAGPGGEQRLKQFAISQGVRQITNVTGALNAIAGNLEPTSPEARQLRVRQMALNMLQGALQSQLDTSLAQDPSRGEASDFNGNPVNTTAINNPAQGILQLMLQMMQLLLQLLGGGQQRLF